MSLPNLSVPLFKLKLPSNGEEITYRPFLVKEEKILLVAKEAKDIESVTLAVQQVLENCTEGQVDVKKLPTFDLEYLFLNIRAKSLGEEIELKYKHKTGKNRDGVPCDAVTPVYINVDDIKVKNKDGHTSKIMVSDTVGIQMKYPTIDLVNKIENFNDEASIPIIVECIDCLFDENKIYDETTTTKEELTEFVEKLDAKQMSKIREFFYTMPKLTHEVGYTCNGCGQQDTIRLEGLSDFF